MISSYGDLASRSFGRIYNVLYVVCVGGSSLLRDPVERSLLDLGLKLNMAESRLSVQDLVHIGPMKLTTLDIGFRV